MSQNIKFSLKFWSGVEWSFQFLICAWKFRQLEILKIKIQCGTVMAKRETA